MRREQYKTPDEDVAAEFERVCRLFRLALGEPSDRVLFDALMVEANDRGLTWVEGLEYVIEQRRKAERTGPGRRSAQHFSITSDLAGARGSELRKTG